MKTLVALLCAAVLLCSVPVAEPADKVSKQEVEKIEYLISHVESLKDAAFIRNGKAYDAKTAAFFLRRKWQAKAEQVRTANDFIECIASRSSTTGISYKIRMRDGKEIECGLYLTSVLREKYN